METKPLKTNKKRVDFSRYINKYRRKIMGALTKNVGKSQFKTVINTNTKPEIKKILIIRPNHRLGNLLLTTPLVKEVVQEFPDCEIDLLAKGKLAPIVFCKYSNIKNFILLPRKPFSEIIKYCYIWVKVKTLKYDLVVNATKDSSSGRLLTSISNSKYKVFGEIDDLKTAESKHMAKNPIYNLRDYLSRIGLKRNNKSIAQLDLKLTNNELIKGKNILDKIVQNDKKTISIFTYATGKKCYSKTWWNEFYTQLKASHKDYNIIEILPIENISQIDFAAQSFYSKDIREIASVIANTTLFIGADSGIMHLASAAKTTTVGLFSVTKTAKYMPYGNGSIALHTNKTTISECITEIDKILDKKKKSTLTLSEYYI